MILIRALSDNERYIEGINKLIPEHSVSGKARVVDIDDMELSFKNKNFWLFVAEDTEKEYPDNFVGMTSIFFQRNVMGWIAEIHDVVVAKSYRQRGIGGKLVREAVRGAHEVAWCNKAEIKLFLTSRLERGTHNFYIDLGFALVAAAVGESGTNLYRMTITP